MHIRQYIRLEFFRKFIFKKQETTRKKLKSSITRKMKIQLFTIVLILKTFLLSQIGVEAGAGSACKTDADCTEGRVCFYYRNVGESDVCLGLDYGLKKGLKRV